MAVEPSCGCKSKYGFWLTGVFDKLNLKKLGSKCKSQLEFFLEKAGKKEEKVDASLVNV
jgi:hypothetical protein